MTTAHDHDADGTRTTRSTDGSPPGRGVSRRGFVGWVLAGSTLAVAADLTTGARPADAAVPTPPQVPELYDLGDLQTQSALPTSQLITITVDEDGLAHFAMPRMEVGQGITTAAAMIIAEELDMAVEDVRVTLAPARPELVFNQLTGGSNTMQSMFTPIRVAASVAKGRLLAAAATALGAQVSGLTTKAGVVTRTDGASVTYGELSAAAASDETVAVEVGLKARDGFDVLGTPRSRDDALAAVTGRKRFTMDLEVPDALPTMLCRPPTLNGSPRSLRNRAQVEAMPGVTDVAVVDTGVAVRAATFGQCIDAVRAMDVDWEGGPVDGEDDASILATVMRECGKRTVDCLLVDEAQFLTDAQVWQLADVHDPIVILAMIVQQRHIARTPVAIRHAALRRLWHQRFPGKVLDRAVIGLGVVPADPSEPSAVSEVECDVHVAKPV